MPWLGKNGGKINVNECDWWNSSAGCRRNFCQQSTSADSETLLRLNNVGSGLSIRRLRYARMLLLPKTCIWRQ